MSRAHETVDMETIVRIDKGISKLMKMLWDRGIRTEYCCEGDDQPNWTNYCSGPKNAYILFQEQSKAEKFVKILEKIFSSLKEDPNPYLTGALAFYEREPEHGGGASVHFPKELIPLIEKFLFERLPIWQELE